MVQTVIFDMDGVIIDSEPIYFKIEKQLFEELNIAVPYEEHCSYVGTSSQNMWETIFKKHDVSGNAQAAMQKEHTLYMDYLLNEKNLRPIDGVVELIKDLQQNNFKMIIASSSYMEVIEIVLSKFHLSDYFTGKVSGTQLVNSKPHPEIFIHASRLAKSEPADCVVIEDSQNGITSARAAGMKCIGFLNPNSGVQDLSGANRVIKSFREIDADFIRAI
jgi:HAD superfamily hydrolase (TIGR01509 family)